MSVTTVRKGSVCVVSVDGALTSDCVEQFGEQVRQAFADGAHDFVVDMSEATGINSKGLEALTRLRRECDERLGMIKLCSLSPVLKKILEITRLTGRFEQYEALPEALESFK
ncbi:MAG: STAS domain-containing protein [Phycisphaerae bacterium]